MSNYRQEVARWSRLKWRGPDALIALMALLAALAVLFGTADGTSEAARQGIRGVHAEGALSAAATARNQVAQAQVLAVAAGMNAATETEFSEAIRLAEQSMSILTERLGGLEAVAGENPALDVTANRFLGATEEIVALMSTGRLAESRAMIEGGFEENYQSLVTSLAEYRDGQLLGLQLSQENAGRVANAARFGVAFLVPLTFVLAVRRNQRRRQQRIALEQEIQNQRAITRAKDEAIANLSHELRTPLTSIYGFAMTLVEEPSSASPEIAQVIASESADLSRMVDDLLTAARSDNEALMFRQEVVDPVLEVKKVLDPLAHIITVETRLADAEILADRLRFRQMLRNLVSNAIKHGAAPIAIRGRVDGESYVIEVIDSGPGVSAEISARIFERYVHRGQAPLVTGSVGLGLSIVRLLAEGMDSTVSYRRTTDLTVFELRLPLVQTREAPKSLAYASF